MLTKRTFFPAIGTALLALAIPVSMRGQDVYQLRDLAWKLDLYAGRTWTAARDMPRRGPASGEVTSAAEGFYQRVRQFANQSDYVLDVNAPRDQVRSLLRDAERIDRLVYQTSTDGQVRREWEQARNIMNGLADMYGIRYEASRELPRYSTDESRRGRYEYGRNRYENGREDYDYRRNYRGGLGGEMTWQGIVDGSDLITIQGDRVWMDHLAAQPGRNVSFNFSSALPRARVNVNLQKLQGRGHVQLVEYPSPENNYTARVRIDDPKSGQDHYAFRLEWWR